jgi:tetratricopeptide (TPR) repeat protein
MKAIITYFAISLTLIFAYLSTQAQDRVIVKESYRAMPTYDFSDPDPVPNISRIYPYFKFDGYSAQPVDKEWKIIELENDYIKVFITPEIGGKVWGAIEKSTGKEFIYFNHSVKFRDVAMRGPWTSGGIETNFGVIGHAPTCSTPVDYMVRENDDGSVSCFIGAIDLPSRTEWRVEVNLQPDKSWFTTSALWHNPTSMDQSYYQWMNAAVKADGNLEFAYPGTNYIGHDGSLHSWPIHPDGMDISFYEKNNFGGYKSYHVLGELTGFYGGYWHDDDFGFGHYSDYDAKPGKKLWIWGLSRQGMIWEQLLTDTDGQYVEIQSGRLFNQEAETSVLTPFKHRSFSPLATDQWTEYWFPVMATEGVVQAIPKASVNLKANEGVLNVWISSNEKINDPLVLQMDETILMEESISMDPATVLHRSIPFSGVMESVSVRIGSEYIISQGGLAGQKLSRPLESTLFDWNSIQGLAIEAKSLEQERNYPKALQTYFRCLDIDPDYIPALIGAASIHYRKAEREKGLKLIRRVLSIDTYEPSANLLYATIHEESGNYTDAIDGYSIAAASTGSKSAAYLGLARIYFKRGEINKAIAYCEQSLQFNSLNLASQELLMLAHRKSKNTKAFNTNLKETLDLDPLNHFSRFEKSMMSGSQEDLGEFQSLITNELPHETYLELAIKYYNLGLYIESEMVLKLSPKNPTVLYWLAYLNKSKMTDLGNTYLKEANDLSPSLVFPFRPESIKVLEWASENTESWKPDYYLGLIWWNLGNIEKAQSIFSNLNTKPDYAPYYLAKAELFNRNDEIIGNSLKRSLELAPDDWRTNLALSNYYLDNGEVSNALQTVEKNFTKNPTNYYLGLHYAKTLLLNNQDEECLDLLENLNVLPNEGATEGYHLYRISNLNLANNSLSRKEYNKIENQINKARLWPENLGVGKPYITDERIEDFIMGMAMSRSGNDKQAKMYFEKVLNFELDSNNSHFTGGSLINIATRVQLGQRKEADMTLNQWRSDSENDKFIELSSLWVSGNSKEVKSQLAVLQKEQNNRNIGSREYYLLWVFNFLISNKI